MRISILLLLMTCWVNISFSQESSLYIGYNYTSEISVYDTLDGTYTLTSSLSLTSDIGDVIGCYGLTRDESSETVYILYSSSLEEDEGIRRIGTLDIATGAITDIGFVGSITDISFVDDVLYGTTGSYYGSYALVSIDTDDATVTTLIAHVSDNYGAAIGFDQITNTMLKFDGIGYTRIDLDPLVETITPSIGHPDECHAVVMKNDSIAIVISYEQIYEFNTITSTFEPIAELSEAGHAAMFGLPECTPPTAEAVILDEYFGDDGAINITVTGGVPAYEFDWNNDETGDFDDDEDLTGLPAGEYTVIIRDSEGCEQTYTYTISSFVSLKELTRDNVTVYPNPTGDFVTIKSESEFTYVLMTINGEKIMEGQAVEQKQISLNDFPSGTYTFVIKTTHGESNIRVVKH